jgi:nucleotide-binding universal stress UspA family protein
MYQTTDPSPTMPMPTPMPETPNAPLLVATDGLRDSDGAVRVGVALARRHGTRAELFSVVEPIVQWDEDIVAAQNVDALTTLTQESRDAALHEQRDRTHPGTPNWPFTIDTGDRVERIVACAEGIGASVIILGLGAHGLSARLLQRETAVRVMRAARTPVLAVPSDAWGVPHSALAAIDFTASSERAARTALSLLGTEGTLYLTHVTPRVPMPQADSRDWGAMNEPGVLARLAGLAKRLAAPPGVQIEYVSLHGEAAHELLAFADQFHVDVIAAGAHGKTILERLVLGSVSTSLVRAARCWVLVAPADGTPTPA